MVNPKPRTRVRPAESVQTADELLNVHATYLGLERGEQKVIQVKSFVTEPAIVKVGKGFTANMDNYESLRIDVSVSIPCYAEEVDAVLEEAADKAHVFLKQELARHGVEY